MDDGQQFKCGPADEPTYDIFEVDAYGTLRPLGAEDPSCNRQIFTDIDPDRLDGADDLIEDIESAYPLQIKVQAMVAEESDDPEAADDDDDRWRSWIGDLDAAGRAALRQRVRDWLEDDIDWDYVEFFPMHTGPQGETLAYFESVDGDVLDALGVVLVYGDRPGSTYFAAELKTDVDTANSKAAELGLDFRFVEEGQPYVAPPPSPLELRRQVLQRHFTLAFGALPDCLLGVLPRPPAVAPMPPAALLPAHDQKVFVEWWKRALERLRDPVQVFVDDDGVRHLGIVGGAVFSIDMSGLVQAWVWQIPTADTCVDLSHGWTSRVISAVFARRSPVQAGRFL